MKFLGKVLFVMLLLGITIVGCDTTPPEKTAPAEQEQVEKPTEKPTTKPTEVPPEPTEAPTIGPEPTAAVIAPDMQMVEFPSTDGTLLKGEYYPPETGPAPVIVLLHQYPLDHEIQWFAIAPWLQNRGLQDVVEPGEMPWGDPSWFPVVPEELNFGVLVFTFRGCQGGCQNANLPGNDRSLWAEDARAALSYASTLPGADPERIVAVGTSIGADGAVDGCLLVEEDGLRCAGAMSWSPGSYLELPYAGSVEQLTKKGVPVRCFAGDADGASAETCRSFSGEGYEVEIDPSSNHGIALVDPDIEIDTLNLLLAFLEETVGE